MGQQAIAGKASMELFEAEPGMWIARFRTSAFVGVVLRCWPTRTAGHTVLGGFLESGLRWVISPKEDSMVYTSDRWSNSGKPCELCGYLTGSKFQCIPVGFQTSMAGWSNSLLMNDMVFFKVS